MRIPAYQIHNVLQQYTHRVTTGGNKDNGGSDQTKPEDENGFTANLKRRELIETLSATIKAKINRVSLTERQKQENNTLPAVPAQGGKAVKNGEHSPFVYNVIDKNHRKVKRTISVTRFYEP